MMLLYAGVGLLVGGAINWAGDALPRFSHSHHELTQTRKWLWLDAAVIALSVVLFAYLGNRFGVSWESIVTALSCSFFGLIAAIDIKYRLVLNVLVFPVAGVALACHLFSPDRAALMMALLGGAMGFALFFLAALLNPGGLGGGDVKLAALIGLMVGFPQVLWALALGILAGGIAAIALILHPRWGGKSTIPYAPFLCLGAVVALLYDPLASIFRL